MTADKKDFYQWIVNKIRSLRGILCCHMILEPGQYLVKIMAGAVGFEQLAKGLITFNMAFLVRGSLIYIGGILLSALINGIDVYTEKRIENAVYISLKEELLGCFLNRKVTGDGTAHSGKLLDTCIRDADILVDFLGMKITDITTPVLVCGISILLVIGKSPLIAVIILGTLIFSFILNLYFLPRYGRINQEIRKKEEELTAGFLEEIQGNAVIRVFLCQKYYLKNMQELTAAAFAENDREIRMRFIHGILVNLLAFSSMTLPFVAGALVVLDGGMQVEELMYITQISGNLLWFMDIMAQAVVSVQKARVSAKRIYEIVSKEQEAASEQAIAVSGDDAVSVRGLSVRYGDKEVLSDVSLTVPKGAYAAFVGESGSGKSTIFKALEQLVPYTGTVSLFGQDVQKYGEKEIRQLFGCVFQDAFMINGSLMENIRLGKEDADEEKILELIKETGLQFLCEGEDGSGADVGENGKFLSGGERQRIAVIRAVLSESPILLLDEITSALDQQNEEIVMKCIRSLRREKTVLIAAQKIKTIQDADCIYVVKDGRIVESGTHAQLLAQNGEYRRLCAGKK